MLFGTLVTAAGFFPDRLCPPGVGEYAGNIFCALALLVSWLVAVVFVPHGVKLLPAPVAAAHDHATARQTPAYQRLRRLIARCVYYRKTVVAATLGLLLLAGLGMAFGVQKQFFPAPTGRKC